ncbi:hypothetical protein DAPPUDRAFT_239986 [Daphnia pulex]|uniref:Uncharacterized protein n=1 Tax=Daphnia pulex TaxID=6669 RepID=E9GAK6_DAPPU|nr:hypothetical protein DAPPUDRAFT_239986 [Daphnia pulex]|eukprot:EFX83260.1 hypothetical protein DAPPUDRAFT_239986 [Daphnia pulex]
MAQRHLLAQLSPSCQVIRIHTMNLSRSNRLGFRFHRIAQLSSAIGLMSRCFGERLFLYMLARSNCHEPHHISQQDSLTMRHLTESLDGEIRIISLLLLQSNSLMMSTQYSRKNDDDRLQNL